MDRIAADRHVDPLALLHEPPHERDVSLLDLAIVKLPRQLLVRGVVLRHDHHARRAFVEAMHDAGAQLAADAAEIGDVMEQRVDQRARVVPGARMHHHAGRLVDDDDVGVLVEDVDREILGGGVAPPRRPAVAPRSTSPSRTAVLALTVFTRGSATRPSSISRWICDRE